jgi:hypothetical protein
MNRALLVALAAAPLAALPLAGTGLQPVTNQPLTPAQPKPVSYRQYAAWLPPGTYYSIVLNSSGDQRRWAVSLMTTKLNVPIVVPPGDNIVIEFKDGWTVKADDEARIVSTLVPFDDSALYNKFGEEPRFVLSAWGTGPAGPVEFVYKEVKVVAP